jgi:hypothetical protein
MVGMPAISPSQFRDFNIEQHNQRQGNENLMPGQGYQEVTSNRFSPAFSGDYSSVSSNPSPASSGGGSGPESEKDW